MKTTQEYQPLHIPVLVTEVLSFLKIRPDGIYLDGTIGCGGHAKEILSCLNHHGRILGIDRDKEALEICRQHLQSSLSSVSLFHASYSSLADILELAGIEQVNGILLDLGLSSTQLNSKRGFSFNTEGPLDMRFNSTESYPAGELIDSLSEEKLTEIIRDFSEERLAKRISRAIKSAQSMNTVADLKEAIRRSTPPANRNRTLARVFQALRIAVNDELTHLQTFLENFLNSLTVGGRVVIISYHSLEDRLVKHTFKKMQALGVLSILTKKPVTPTEAETQSNSRSKSAKLRAAERIA